MARMTYAKAVSNAIAEEMRRDERVILMGLDVGAYGNAFGATQGLFREFGAERVIDMPISEAGYVGAAVGAAATGLRPVAEVQFADFVTIAMDQICNQAANMRYMFGGSANCTSCLRSIPPSRCTAFQNAGILVCLHARLKSCCTGYCT